MIFRVFNSPSQEVGPIFGSRSRILEFLSEILLSRSPLFDEPFTSMPSFLSRDGCLILISFCKVVLHEVLSQRAKVIGKIVLYMSR